MWGIREKTSLLPRSCPPHLSALGVSSQPAQPPATGNGSLGQRDRSAGEAEQEQGSAEGSSRRAKAHSSGCDCIVVHTRYELYRERRAVDISDLSRNSSEGTRGIRLVLTKEA